MPIRPTLKTLLPIGWVLASIVAIFVADTITNYEVAFAIFYSIVIITIVRHVSQRTVLWVCCLCMACTLLSLYLTPGGALAAGILNTVISLTTIAITTYLSLKIIAAEAARNEARAQLQRMARVIGMGEMTGSIAHEINQPLAAVTTSANACLRWLQQTPPNIDKASRSAERVIADANRAANIIVRIRNLGKGQLPEPALFDINSAITHVLSLSQPALTDRNITTRLDLLQSMPSIMADRLQVEQVISNLLLNALEAMDSVPSHQRLLTIHTTVVHNGQAVCLTVADTGQGLSSQARTHLFDAFWSTKQHGMGMGLAICRTIVEAYGGTISAATNTPGGTVFEVTLPVAGDR